VPVSLKGAELLKQINGVLIGMVVSTIALSASTIDITNTYSSSLTNPGAETYNLSTLGNSGIQSSTFTLSPLPVDSSASLTYSNYLASVPLGSSVTGAILDFNVQIGSPAFTPTGVAFYTPVFGGTLGAVTVTITSGAVTHTVSGTSLTGYDLFTNGFSVPLLAGSNLTLAFSAGDTLTANTSTYANDCKNCAESLSIADSRTITGSNTVNILHLAVTSVPEPINMSLMGLGLCALGFFRVRKSS
jgi:hypothetical protein